MDKKNLSQEVLNFLNDTSFKGIAWLSTEEGRNFLKQEACLDWLVSEEGYSSRWLSSLDGENWALEEDNRIISFVHEREFELLKNSTIQKWLTTSSGRHWLATGHGVRWLQSSEGQAWMKTHDGKEYMNVPEELKF